MVEYTLEDYESKPISPENRLFKGMFFGHPGTGKTTIAASIGQLMAKNPNPKSTTIVSTDPGYESLAQFPHLLKTTQQVDFKGADWLTTYINGIRDGAWPEIETLVLDTYSHMQDDVIDHLVENIEWDSRDSRVKTNDDSIFIPGLNDYHYTRNAMRVWINRLMKIPRNIILLAHVHEPNEMEKDKTTRPNATEGVNRVVSRVVQSIGYTEVDETGDGDFEYTVSFAASKKLRVKSWIPDTQGKIFTHESFLEKLNAWKAI